MNVCSESVSLNWNPGRHGIVLRAGVGIILIFGVVSPSLAQDNVKPPAVAAAKPATEKWRPKDGIYAYPDKDFVAHCDEAAYLDVDLAKKQIGGNEWSCDVGKITETAPGAIKLDLTCDDYNLAESIKAPEGKRFKEVMLLNKIDQRSMYVRKTSNGKFGGARWQASYCPDEQQHKRLVLAERSQAEAERRPVAEWAQPKIWLPRDGVYASPGADFDDRCMKSGDAIVDFAGKSITSGAGRCEIQSHIDGTLEEPDPVVMVTCNETHDTKGTIVVRYIDGVPRVGPPGFEIMWLNMIDDKTISLRKTHDGRSSEPARQVAYCSDDAQRRYKEQKAGK